MPDETRPTGADLIVTERAYHFVGSTLRDGRPVPPDGVWLVHDGPVVLCESGLHASRRPWQALQYAPGETLCLVEIADIVEEAGDKLVARRRRIVRRVDLTEDLRAFARQCARDVLHLWAPPEVVRRYLETGDETLRAAAWAAAWAAWSAASAAARTAAGDAALAADWASSAWAAAEEAAWAAAENAARAAARDAVEAASRKAPGAWEAAWAAALDALGARFDALCRARLGVEEVV